MDTILTIMTFVTNGNGVGPGHSAIAFDDTVYSFEAWGDWFNSHSGWITLNYDDYVATNAWRPIILQTLSTKVNPPKSRSYIQRSMAADDDYGPSGVCSSQVASAVDAGLTFSFDPDGIDTPYGLYWKARRAGLVLAENIIWEDQTSMTTLQWASIVNKLNFEYPQIAKRLEVHR